MAVSSFSFQNLLSIHKAKLEVSTPVTLLIGPNGSGKSNVLRGIELLSRLADDTFRDTIMRSGGFSDHLFKGTELSDFAEKYQGKGFDPECFAVSLIDRRDSGLLNLYDVQFLRGVGNSPLVRERLLFWDTDKYEQPYYDDFTDNYGWRPVVKESVLSERLPNSADTGIQRHIREILAGCRVFHFEDSSSRSPVFASCDIADNLRLHYDGNNLAAVLLRMQETDKERYQGILRSVRSVAPFFDDFVVTPEYEGSNRTLLRWKQRGIDNIFSAERLSSGTLRFICLAVLLQQTNAPQTIVLDEPELGLHPFAIYQLGEMLREVTSEEKRIIVTTQSVTLADQFTLEEIALVTRENGGTVINRPDPKEYTAWLEDYSVGQMWESNVLNVAPRNEVLFS